ncbi:response regulator [Aeromonas caviae]|uniref:response regulator n=1 Tax=Aeromonas caviae TaxID=648 RepID=UPI0038D0F716
MSRPRVLIIDDEPSNLGLLRQILKEEYNLFFAKGGEEGLAAVGRHEPALILLDVRMPDMDGYEVCRRLKADPAHAGIPVLFITASDNADSESQGEWIISTSRSVRARCVPGCAIISPWCASISSSAAIAPPSSC